MSWGFVQSASKTGSGAVTSLTCNLTGVTAGDLLCVSVTGYFGYRTYTVSDGTANVYTAGTHFGTAGNGVQVLTFYCLTTVGGSLSVVATVGGGLTDTVGMGIEEYSHLSGVPITLAGSGGTVAGSAGTSLSSGNISFSGPGNFLVWGACASQSAGVWTAGSGFTERANYLTASGSHDSGMDEDRLNLTSANSPISITATTSASSVWAVAALVFLETPQPVLRSVPIICDQSGSRRRLLAE